MEISRADIETFKTYSDGEYQKLANCGRQINRVSKRIVNVLSSRVGQVFCSILIRETA